MLHDQRNMTAGVAALMELQYARDVLPSSGFNLLPPQSSRHPKQRPRSSLQCLCSSICMRRDAVG